ncbi:MAG: T9SS type A sorting domain-containing protein, partial [Flavobacteriales bacterium]|nr:T9SS type A sorting domain-containing protein [Flavobacteriales bacterium]
NNAIGPYSITVDGVNCINTGLSTSEAPSLGLFPNPTSGVLNVLNPGTEAAFTLEVLDMAGRAVHAERARIAQGASHTVQLHRLAPGTYTLRATTPQARTEQRFVIH